MAWIALTSASGAPWNSIGPLAIVTVAVCDGRRRPVSKKRHLALFPFLKKSEKGPEVPFWLYRSLDRLLHGPQAVYYW